MRTLGEILDKVRKKLFGKEVFGIVTKENFITCPCCGGTGKVTYSGGDNSSGYVTCPICGGKVLKMYIV